MEHTSGRMYDKALTSTQVQLLNDKIWGAPKKSQITEFKKRIVENHQNNDIPIPTGMWIGGLSFDFKEYHGEVCGVKK